MIGSKRNSLSLDISENSILCSALDFLGNLYLYGFYQITDVCMLLYYLIDIILYHVRLNLCVCVWLWISE